MLGQARVFYAMSRDGLLPKAVGYVSAKSGAPVMGMSLHGCWRRFLPRFFPFGCLG